jgi:serine/threonine protein phosphatase PrpC
VKEHLIDELKKLPSFKSGNYEQALKDIYLRIDEMLKTAYGKTKLQSYKKSTNDQNQMFGRGTDDIAYAAGCTACSAIITPTEIIVGNSGDSRAVLARKGKVAGKYTTVAMSEDHKPDLGTEKARIERAGGFVEDNRVKGVLNLSRSLGDLEYKTDPKLKPEEQMITAVPEIKKEKIDNAAFLIIACDGIWDCLTSQEAVETFGSKLQTVDKCSKAIEDVFDNIIA